MKLGSITTLSSRAVAITVYPPTEIDFGIILLFKMVNRPAMVVVAGH